MQASVLRHPDAYKQWPASLARRTHLHHPGYRLSLTSYQAAPTLRMDEFVAEDTTLRAAVLRAALDAMGVLGPYSAEAEAQLAAAAAVFGVNSQAGSAMAGTKRRFLETSDLPLVHGCVRRAFGQRPGVQVEHYGENILLDGSL